MKKETESLFSLDDLRDYAESPHDTLVIGRSAYLALLDAVEAARTLRSFQRTFEPEHRGLPDIRSRLDEKLEVFGVL